MAKTQQQKELASKDPASRRRGSKRSRGEPPHDAPAPSERAKELSQRAQRSATRGRMEGGNGEGGGSAAGGNIGGSDGGAGGDNASRAAAAMADAERALREALEGRMRGGGDNSDGGAGNASALHGLLRRLGAGLEELMPGMGATSSRLKALLQALKQEGDDSAQMEALGELCEVLSMANEESLAAFNMDSFVPTLVNLLNAEHNPDMMLLAARALTHLMDVMPQSCGAVVHYGAIPSFCARLLTIEFIDLAEQCLQALEKLSKEHPAPCLRAGGLMAVLSYLDFFSTGVQRVAMSTAANICRQLSPASADMVAEVVPNLTNILQYHDTKLVEHACVCVSRIADSWARDADRLQTLCGESFLDNTLALLSAGSGADTLVKLSPPTYTALVRTLGACANGNPAIAAKLLERDAHKTISDVLGSVAAAVASPGAPYARSSEQQFELLNLASALLPAMPDAVQCGPDVCTPGVGGAGSPGPTTRRAATQQAAATADATAQQQREEKEEPKERAETRGDAMLAFEAAVTGEPALATRYADSMYSTLMHVHGHTSNPLVRHKCMLSLTKLLYYSTPAHLEELLRTSPVSSFLAELLGAADTDTAMAALVISELLLDKLPGIFRRYFMKEGVVHQIERLAAKEGEAAAGGAAPPLSPRTPRQPTRSSLSLSQRARALKEKHFADAAGDGGASMGETEGLQRLKALCARLSSGPLRCTGDAAACAKSDREVLGELARALMAGEGISTFELLSSGTIGALKAHVTGAGLPEGLSMTEREAATTRRLADLVAATAPQGATAAEGTGLHVLVDKLCQAFNVQERFPVVLSAPPPGVAASDGTSLSALAQPIKLRLCRASGERSLRDYATNVVLIEPLESLLAVDDFLWPRVHKPEPPRSRPVFDTPAADKGKGAAEEESAQAEPARATTRSMTKAAEKAQTSPDGDKRPVSALTRSLRSTGAAGAAAAMEHDGGEGGTVQAGSSGDVDMVDDDAEPMEADDAAGVDDDDSPDEDEEDGDEDDDEDEDEDEYHDDYADDYAQPFHDDEDRDEMPTADPVQDIEAATSSPEGSQERASQGGGSGGRSQAAGRSKHSGGTSKATGMGSGDGAGGARRGGAGSSGSYAAAAAAAKGGFGKHGVNLIFSVNGSDVPPGSSIFSALGAADAQSRQGESGQPQAPRRLWDTVHSISYRRADEATVAALEGAAEASRSRAASAPVARDLAAGRLPGGLDESTPGYDALYLLRMLWLQASAELRARGVDVPPHLTKLFVSTKLSSKLSRQLQDPLMLSGGLPTWCAQLMEACPFLFTFEARRQYLHGTAFGLPRALQRLRQQQAEGGTSAGRDGGSGRHGGRGSEPRAARLQRQKVRLARSEVLAAAFKVMDMCAGSRSTLEIEYFKEVGTGLGPTLEFYTLLGHALQERKLNLWRDDGPEHELAATDGAEGEAMDVDGEGKSKGKSKDRGGLAALSAKLVRAPRGLFPRPLPVRESRAERVLKHFTLLGSSVGKALQDGRLMDIYLAPAFWDLMIAHVTKGAWSREVTPREVDPALAATLDKLQAYSSERQRLLNEGRAADASALTVDGATIDDLCLEWACPGYPDAKLSGGAAGMAVSADEVSSYAAAVADAHCGAGVARQVAAFAEGLRKVFAPERLACFTAEELNELVGGSGYEQWDKALLLECVKFDHGYTSSSPAIGFLVEILSELDATDQRAFLRFVTGAPRLPTGGLAALSPRLTVVRKQPQAEGDAANSPSPAASKQLLLTGDLPSVMTCVNYLKMPPYSTKAAMRERLMYAVRHGQGSFDLS